MSEAPQYRISTVEDFSAIPLDRIDACLEDFKAFLVHANQAQDELVKLLGPEVKGMVSIGKSFTWVDDGRVGIGAVDFYLDEVKVGRIEVGEANG